MKIKFLIGAGCLFLLLLLILNIRSCNNEDKERLRLSELKGQFEAYKAKADEQKKRLEAENIEKEERILAFKNRVIALENEAIKIEQEIDTKDEKIKKLESEFSLTEDKDQKITNLQNQVDLWKEKFSLAMVEVEKEREAKKNWKASYEDQVVITKNLKKQLADEANLRKVAEELISGHENREKKLESQIWRLKMETKFERIVLFGLAVYGGAKILK